MKPLSHVVIGSLLILAWPSAHAADGQKIFNQGGQNPAAMACLGCHGPDGKGIAAAGFPRLAGLPAGYLSKQLQDFRSGSRKQAVMEPLAKALDDAEIEAISAYLAKLPADPAPDTRRQQIATNPVARLALYGDWSRKIPGCVQCHGPGGSGVGEHFPPLAGQPAGYLVAQLNAWRDGSRSNDPNQLMVDVAKAMTDAEVKAVADYFAQPASQEAKP
ncbi:cytochrome c4 [Pseudomonas soli]|jgi:cytochrome c553|uniref:C-type cytochrome n=1 Tax=Pseudomonas soli TaxID=1306993 RepID=A0A1H9LA26_9PSED|nr:MULTISPECIES: c-type cytochrome [Pseudomonas]AUY36826.1 cytochrome c4 [Pseudomonas sp. PONIH3]MEE1879698.1 c-type cytochrome [Pseudomonas soli]NBK42088.1 cytochrome c4 [Pseudomonas soli]WJO20049.1 c-type cytochrome [Pseudomonas soli]SER08322.1 Cytochrome c553 [Pseudomonas soli]